MAGFKLQAFRGLRPRLSARLLAEGEAVAALNVRLGSGDLEPWKGPNTAVGAGYNPTKTIYYYENGGSSVWLQWNTDVDVARSPVEEDALGRIYYTGAPDDNGAPTGSAKPKLTWQGVANTGSGVAPKTWRYLGLPAPVPVPDAAPTNSSPLNYFGGFLETQTVNMILPYNNPSYPGTCTLSDYLTIDTGTAGSVDYTLGVGVGDEWEVASVIDGTYITVRNKNNQGYLTSTASASATWARNNSGACVNQIGAGAIFYIPDGARMASPGHNMKAGDTLIVSQIVSPSYLRFADNNTVYDAEDWGLPYSAVVDGTTYYTHNNKAIWKDATGSVRFELKGSFGFEYYVGDPALDSAESRSYVYTYLSSLQEESPPSEPTEIISVYDGQSVTITNIGPPPSPYAGYLSGINIYRTSTGLEQTDYFYVTTIAANAITAIDVVPNASLGDALESTNYDPPPATMRGIVTLPNGSLAGFDGNKVLFSEPYRAHAWPYFKYVDATIVGLAAFGDSLLVATNRTPYVMTGAHPRSMAVRKMEFEQPCVSRNSIAVAGDTVLYASPDGLVAVNGSGASLVSTPYMTKREWSAYTPLSMNAAVLDQRYHAFYTGSAGTGMLVIDPIDEVVGMTLSDVFGGAISYEPLTDALYFVDNALQVVRRWDQDASEPLTAVWQSGRVLVPMPVNFGCARVQADAYPVTFSLYADGVLKHTQTVASIEPFRLPGGYLSSDYSVSVSGTTRIRTIEVGETMEDLKGG